MNDISANITTVMINFNIRTSFFIIIDLYILSSETGIEEDAGYKIRDAGYGFGNDRHPGFLKHSIIIQQFCNTNDHALKQYTEFVMSDDNGPINWGDKKISIGIDEFVLSKARNLYGVSTRQLIEPRGADERQKRQFIITDLHERFRYSGYFIAKVFCMSNSMVSKILKKSTQSNTE